MAQVESADVWAFTIPRYCTAHTPRALRVLGTNEAGDLLLITEPPHE